MKRFLVPAFFFACFASSLTSAAQEVTQPNGDEFLLTDPIQALHLLVGDWECKIDATMIENGGPQLKFAGTESGALTGEQWVNLESKLNLHGMETKGIMTLGYNPRTRLFEANWIDSLQDQMLHYQGILVPSSNAMLLATIDSVPGHLQSEVLVVEWIHFRDADHRETTSFILQNGGFVRYMSTEYTRKK